MTDQVEITNAPTDNEQIMMRLYEFSTDGLESFAAVLAQGELGIAVNMAAGDMGGRPMHVFTIIGAGPTESLFSDVVKAIESTMAALPAKGGDANALGTGLSTTQDAELGAASSETREEGELVNDNSGDVVTSADDGGSV